jgi:hypothetical protein
LIVAVSPHLILESKSVPICLHNINIPLFRIRQRQSYMLWGRGDPLLCRTRRSEGFWIWGESGQKKRPPFRMVLNL